MTPLFFILSVVNAFWSFETMNFNALMLKFEYPFKPLQVGVGSVSHFTLLLMNTLNKTESAIFTLVFDFFAFEGSPFQDF